MALAIQQANAQVKEELQVEIVLQGKYKMSNCNTTENVYVKLHQYIILFFYLPDLVFVVCFFIILDQKLFQQITATFKTQTILVPMHQQLLLHGL